MSDFKIGDIVRAKKKEDGKEIYVCTNSSVRCEILGVGKAEMRGRIMDGFYKGEVYWVEKKDFYKLVNRTE